MTTHSLISPSNFERRMICPGSLNAEKDLPDVKSKYSEEGTLLHEKTAEYIEFNHVRRYSREANGVIDAQLTKDQEYAVEAAGDYFLDLRRVESAQIHQFHEQTYDLSFIYDGMKGTADSVLILDNRDTNNIEVHVIDYKFGRGVAVSAYQNFQLILYYLGVINNPDIKDIIKNKQYSVHLHIVQPFIKNSRWDLTEEDRLEIENLKFYQDVVEACYAPNVKRIAHTKACRFCKAKPTCPALAKKVPKLDVDVFDLEDAEIAEIYDNRELTKLYLSSIEEYITNRLSSDGFPGYSLVDKLSNRKWNDSALTELPNLLGEDAYETTKKLIGISKAERLLGKTADIINKLTTREVTGVEILKNPNDNN
jgi:RecB family exonuclease